MEVTAAHIHEKQFHDAWRGYNQEEVDDFLDRVAEQMNRLERENQALQDRLRDLDQMVAASRSTEEMLKKTLVTAQQAAEEAIATAKSKAERMVTEAEERAHRANEELKERVATAEEEVRRKTAEAERQQLVRRRETQLTIERLEGFEAEIKRRLKAFLEQQLDSLEALVEKPQQGAGGATPIPPQPALSSVGPARLHATPAARMEAVAHEARAEAGDAPVVAEDAAVIELSDDPDIKLDAYADAENGDIARKHPLRAMFRRDNREEDWSDEGR
ncbi:MAG: DivIVA domain-containing protein [Actinomycetota bacterium]|nr:DivIVA domain-containing protein [Actinomycetota bacterium]